MTPDFENCEVTWQISELSVYLFWWVFHEHIWSDAAMEEESRSDDAEFLMEIMELNEKVNIVFKFLVGHCAAMEAK